MGAGLLDGFRGVINNAGTLQLLTQGGGLDATVRMGLAVEITMKWEYQNWVPSVPAERFQAKHIGPFTYTFRWVHNGFTRHSGPM